ncbi:MAG: multiheme c-type cytochrome [Bryobacteraceae bacterium]
MWKDRLRDSGHLVRLLLLVAVAVSLFLVVRAAVIPDSFGQYGHYRPGALADNQKHPLIHAGQAECTLCHEDEVKARNAGKHSGVACEACHGPLAAHAADPDAHKPVLPAVTPLCTNCHEKDAAKPKWFPQVASKQHSEGMDCNSCHQPHQPKL